MSNWTVHIGDVLATLPTLPEKSVRCCVTSPPYWGLRQYIADDAPEKPHEIGLEPTPAEYIARMVAVFAAVRRVLTDDGTVWVNMGDGYAGNDGIGRNDAGRNFTGGGGNILGSGNPGRQGKHERSTDLKPKDLIGMPWRLAFALQHPQYTGRITDERDRIWLAAMIDAEGCMFIHRRKAGQSNGQGYVRQNDNYGPGLEICNTHPAVIDRIMQIVGKGSVCTSDAGKHGRKQTLYRWNLRTTESRDLIREVYPYLVAKQHQARLLCGCPSSGKDAERAHLGLIALHRGHPTDINFKPPESLHTPGWYLRSDIIWAKNNPMPESVTDRPTKAHEYVFLLSKQERYFYDAAAIAEESIRSGDDNLGDRNVGDGYVSGGWLKGGTVPPTRNRRTVWTIATQPYKEAHFATFPEKLVVPCILAGTSERGGCPKCGAAWKRVVDRIAGEPGPLCPKQAAGFGAVSGTRGPGWRQREQPSSKTVGWAPSCKCNAGDPVPDTVLDPFNGSGTTGAVSVRHGRNYVGIELNPKYAEMARKRIGKEAPLFVAGGVS
jgi:DNA modification methylase